MHAILLLLKCNAKFKFPRYHESCSIISASLPRRGTKISFFHNQLHVHQSHQQGWSNEHHIIFHSIDCLMLV